MAFQSTHLREVRQTCPNFDLGSSDFNPRTCVRCDVEGHGMDMLCLGKFQSTHLREVRPSLPFSVFDIMHFNPRTCVRCDLSKFSSTQ